MLRFQFSLGRMLAATSFLGVALACMQFWLLSPGACVFAILFARSLSYGALRDGRRGVRSIAGIWLLLFSIIVAVLSVIVATAYVIYTGERLRHPS
jgi:ABC-type Mn2+/Zn2+ transport system permease subunit